MEDVSYEVQGAHFCAGADLQDMPADVLPGMPNLSVTCDKPIIAANAPRVVHGLKTLAGIVHSADREEGIAAFAQKCAPAFTGR